MAQRKLQRYRAKRDFERTPEPSGTARTAAAGSSYVIQRHAARRLHYDFRLELDGVLLSWAVPKGPSLRAGEKRLAVRTEDHPLDYRDFEGAIPKGEYGGGTVLVWDRGTWTCDGDPREALKRGRLTFTLDGEKLTGRFHLVRTKAAVGDADGVKASWLLFKSQDAAARASGPEIVDARPESVISGRTIEEIAKKPGRIWHSERAAAGESMVALVSKLPTKVALTNLQKELYPEVGITKAALVAYYATVRDWILPHVAGRPLSLLRCPDGAGAKRGCFFQKHHNEGVPASLTTVDVPEENGQVAQHMKLEDLDGLIGLVQLGVLEIHTWGCHADKLERPDQIVMDLDPDAAVGWAEVVRAAVELRGRFEALGLESFVKTTGGKGLHVVVPVERRLEWDDFKAFTRGIAARMVEDDPERFVINARKAVRGKKIFVDYLRNGRGATAIAPYSTRAREGAPVAAPVSWDELERGVDPKAFTVRSMPDRVDALGGKDPWRGYAAVKQRITAGALKDVLGGGKR